MLHDNLTINEKGNLCINGKDTVELAKKYGTPLMVLDEDKIRNTAQIYLTSMKKYFGESSLPLYASKALSFKQMYRIMKEEGMGIDVVSVGEFYTALKAGFDVSEAYFHSNNKTDFEIEFAIDNKIGYFVCDNKEELDKIDDYAGIKGIKQNILLRLAPGIDPHTHSKISTGRVDSKFGTAIETGQAFEFVKYVLTKKNVCLKGFHCHIGSQIFDVQPFCDASDIMVMFIAKLKEELSFTTEILNLGGGFAVRYVESDQVIDYEKNIELIAKHVKDNVAKYNLTMPSIRMEPGRSIVGASGITLYTVGSVKEITGFKNYVAIDGGMTDNPRYALYQADYTCLIANKAGEKADYKCTVAGRSCESGDLIQEDTMLQKATKNDILCVLSTGAYNYSMASNYNRVCRPAVVMVNKEKDYLVVDRESLDDLIKNDI